MKKIILLMLMIICGWSISAQEKKKNASPNKSALTAKQQLDIKAINENHKANMLALINQPLSQKERIEKIKKLSLEKDSALKAAIGDDLFEKRRRKITVKSKS